jgi:phosphatidylethanolamine/phosphatidyl-N-methylethanolamine N-methyltransferase
LPLVQNEHGRAFDVEMSAQAGQAGQGRRKHGKNGMQLLARLNATTLFLQECLTSPRQIGAVLPSSKNLGRAMARWVPRDKSCYALELGPGSGSITEALLAQGLPEDRLIAVEQSPKLADLLRAHYPKATIITGDAFQLEELLRSHPVVADKIGVVFSSLPLLNFEPALADSLARQIRALLPPNGKLVQWSYNIGKRQPKAASHFRFVASQLVWFNVPPARVSVYRK